MFNPKYYPILKWKRGEQQAVHHLDPTDRAHMFPIIEVVGAPITGLLGALAPSLTLGHAHQFPTGIDLKYLYPAGVPIGALARWCVSAQKAGFDVHPVINAPDLFHQLGQVSSLAGCSRVVLRLRLATLMLTATLQAIEHVRKAVGKKAELHVVLDFGPVGEVDPAALAAYATPHVQGVLAQGLVNYVAIAGGSFPLTLTGIPVGVNNFLPRREWAAWQAIRSQLGCDPLRFGDYNVTNPEPQEVTDPSTLNPSAAIRYALDGEWWLLRARSAKQLGYHQYNTLCRVLVTDPRYFGQTYSYGDGRYHHHAQPNASSGNFTTWRRDAASHHLVQTVRRLDQLI